MSITVNCSIDLTEDELLLILRHRQAGKTPLRIDLDKVLAAETVQTTRPAQPFKPLEATPPPAPAPEPEVIPEERIEAVETVIAAALPPKPTRSRAKANGAEAPLNATPLTPSPPPPEPLDEPAMRSLLSKVGTVHPLKVKAITNILETCGGARRLSECDPVTWPAIAEAAHALLAEYGA